MATTYDLPVSGSPIMDGGKYQSGWTAPTDYSDPMCTHKDLLGQGGLMVGNTAYRDRINSTNRIKRGMFFVIGESTDPNYGNIYVLHRSDHPTNPGVDLDITNPANRVLYVGGGAIASTEKTDPFTITQLDITNGYIDLTETPLLTKHITLYYDGPEEGPATGTNPDDGMRTLTGNRITFNDAIHDLYIGARIEIKYSY